MGAACLIQEVAGGVYFGVATTTVLVHELRDRRARLEAVGGERVSAGTEMPDTSELWTGRREGRKGGREGGREAGAAQRTGKSSAGSAKAPVWWMVPSGCFFTIATSKRAVWARRGVREVGHVARPAPLGTSAGLAQAPCWLEPPPTAAI